MYCGWIWKDTSVCSKEKSPWPRFLVSRAFISCPHWHSLKAAAPSFSSPFKDPTVNHAVHCDKVEMCVSFPPRVEKGPKNYHSSASTFPSLRLTIKFSHVMCLPSATVRTPVSSTWPVILQTAWIQQYFWITFSVLGILSYILDYILIQFTSCISFPTILFLTLFRPASSPWD